MQLICSTVFIVYEKSRSIDISDYPTLENCLFGAVTLTKNADFSKYKYSGYGIGFDRHGSFSFPGTGLGRNAIIFGVDMSSSTKIDNRKKDVLILDKGPAQRLQHTLSAEKSYLIYFTVHNKKFCSSLHIKEQIVIYLLMVKKFINLRRKILRLYQLHYV